MVSTTYQIEVTDLNGEFYVFYLAATSAASAIMEACKQAIRLEIDVQKVTAKERY